MGMLVVNLVDAHTGAMMRRGVASGDVGANASPKKVTRRSTKLLKKSSATTRLRSSRPLLSESRVLCRSWSKVSIADFVISLYEDRGKAAPWQM